MPQRLSLTMGLYRSKGMYLSATMNVLLLHKRVAARIRAAELLARTYEPIPGIPTPYFCQVKAFEELMPCTPRSYALHRLGGSGVACHP